MLVANLWYILIFYFAFNPHRNILIPGNPITTKIIYVDLLSTLVAFTGVAMCVISSQHQNGYKCCMLQKRELKWYMNKQFQ